MVKVTKFVMDGHLYCATISTKPLLWCPHSEAGMS